MPRTARSVEGGMVYHVLNRGNGRMRLFHKTETRKSKQIEYLQTEEATKTALVMPLVQALGYNVFNPTEVIPEFTADVGAKKGEKVDYAILHEGKPIILFECKAADTDLDKEHASQLYRYFSVPRVDRDSPDSDS